jgi:hypothetical protein
MTTLGDPLETSLSVLALVLAEAFDAGWEARPLLAALTDAPSGSSDQADVATDVVLAATSLLAGVAPDLPGLIGNWGRPRLVEVALATSTRAKALVRPV